MVVLLNLLVDCGCLMLAWLTLSPDRVAGIALLRQREEDSPDGKTKKQLGERRVRLLAVCMALCVGFVMWRLSVRTSDTLNLLKLSLTLVCLVGSACVDFMEHRIPNLFPGVLALGAVCLLSAGFLLGQEGALSYVVSSVFASVLTTLCLAAAALLSRGGIGVGDIKLTGSLALMGGVNLMCGTLFFAMLSCAMAAVVLLLLKKKTIKQSVPFGPFVLFGYMLTICTIPF